MKLLAACAFGLEALVKRELHELGYDSKIVQPGRIQFTGDWSAVCRCNLWLRTADRILIEVLQFPAPDFDALFETVKAHDFSEFIPSDASFPVSGRSRLSQLTSVPAIQRSVKKAMVESLQRTYSASTLTESGASYPCEIALLNDTATLTIDTSGPSLHRRGYRHPSARMPMKETLAAALVQLSVWNPLRTLVDPFCGSGTIAIEAALIGMRRAPGLGRNFASSHWPNLDPALWQNAKTEAEDQIVRDVRLQIMATDIDDRALNAARFQVDLAKVASHVHIQQKPFAELRSKREFGCVITNPPCPEDEYQQRQVENLYLSIPAVMQRLPSWSLFVLTNFPGFEKRIGQSATRRRKLYNDRLECTYYQFLGPKPPTARSPAPEQSEADNSLPVPSEREQYAPEPSPAERTESALPWRVEAEREGERLPSRTEVVSKALPDETPPDPAMEAHPHSDPTTNVGPQATASDDAPLPSATYTERPSKPRSQPIFGGLEPKDEEQAQLFRNRLQKLARHLRKWPTKRGITCFRLYEKDIPEIPLVVDRYENFLHMTEYERPHDRSLARHAAWLELMKKTAASTLDIPIQNVFLKQRLKNRESHQYEKMGSSGNQVIVQESGLQFYVNLTDYVDTGLFLDHRVTRQMVRDEAENSDFLNLFAYTGSFSVYAAAGGARSTTTVDLSKNYLQWAERNAKLNGFAGAQYQYVPADAFEFLREARQSRRSKFTLAVVDPPTYSNSKRTEQDWDVQTHHAALLNELRELMTTGGIVYFSTNFRRFKLEEAELAAFDIREISKRSVPEDFRNRRIHRCWRMVVK